MKLLQLYPKICLKINFVVNRVNKKIVKYPSYSRAKYIKEEEG